MREKGKQKLVLLDAHAIIHRAYHALPGFSNSTGEPTGALYGLIAMLLKIVAELEPDYLVACYDLPGKTFRHEAYEKYKDGRGKAEDDLVEQLERSRAICEAFNIPIYDHPGFEADDMLGTIVEQTKNKKTLDIIIASGDMDTLQLVDGKRVQVFTLRKGMNDTVLYDEKAVKDRFGFGPELLADYKGLRGDPSDNIIGIAGVGEKTATELITNFGSIEEVYRALEKKPEQFEKKGIKPRIVNLLAEGQEDAEFSKTLAEIRRDAPITFSLPKKTWRDGFNLAKAEELMGVFEFRTLLHRLRDTLGVEAPVEQEDVLDEKEIERIAIGVWLLNSEMTNPGLDDVMQYTGAKDFKQARQMVLGELKEKKLVDVYEKIELPLVPILYDIERRGVKIDVDHFKKLSKKYHKELEVFEKKIYKHAGTTFNINSPKQLGEILFDKLLLSTKGLKKTAGGAGSTRESELLKLKDEHPIIEEILSYRELQKVLSTYVDNLPDMADKDGRLHSNLIQTGTTTGRFASQNPNLQNIPIRHHYGKEIREGFIADKGYRLVAFDYSQIELRITALLSKEKDFIDVFKEGRDIHASVASRVFDVPEDKVTNEMRRRAKVINFGIIYGMGVNALRENLGGSRAEAQEFYDHYFASFGNVRDYLEGIKTDAKKKGYTETMFGRRRYFPALKSHIPYIRATAERMAVNAPIQGTAADIIKIALKQVQETLVKEKLTDKVFPILQIHDELLFEIKADAVKGATPIIEGVMQEVFEHSFLKYDSPVPLLVHVSVADNWGDMK